MKQGRKRDGTPVTPTDQAINRLVIRWFHDHYPHIHVISEEGSRPVNGSKYLVFCDPNDGTIPFCRGVPVSTFCLSIVKEGLPLVGLIYDPLSGRMWHATQGQGSFCNNKRIRVSSCRTMSRACVSMVWWRNSSYDLPRVCQRILNHGSQFLNLCAIAYSGGLLASGNLEATIFPGSHPWEAAAMHILVQEAGGMVTDIHGNDIRYTPTGRINGHIMSNGLIHNKLLTIVNERQERDNR